MNLLLRLALGLLLSGGIALLAWRRSALTASGALGAVLVGTAIFGFGGLAWGMLLITFFVLSTLLSHYKESVKERIAAEKFDKGSVRDLGQALANGGAGAGIAALAFLFLPEPVMLAAFVGAMATVNADTWATEIGVLSRRTPRLITTLQPVERGTSGGVTWLGTLATAAGGLAIGLGALLFLALDAPLSRLGLGALAHPGMGRLIWLLLVSLAGGLGGSLFDSLLGASVQAIYYCPACQKETEKRVHGCGTPTRLVRGWRWLNNDLVNFAASVFGALAAAGLWLLVN
ncbi:MAG TPA: DUF92 domain-containing protein [Aggregatilineales bacterium]|nr:DUF92 domain-containing protein [Aggregatilineales bacterium]